MVSLGQSKKRFHFKFIRTYMITLFIYVLLIDYKLLIGILKSWNPKRYIDVLEINMC